MATYSTVKNVSGSPLPITGAGSVLGAGEFGTANVDAQPAKGHVDARRLVVVERPSGDVELDAGASAAFDETDARNAGSSSAPAEDVATASTTPTPRSRKAGATTTEA